MPYQDYRERRKKRVVSARDLHEFLGATERFANWFERQLQFGFVENEDYVGCKEFNTLANQELTNYAISIDMAKEISMIQKSEKGKEARKYFIACEKELSKTASTAKIDMTMAFYKGAAEILGMNDSSKLLMMQNIAKELDLPLSGLPAYTKSIDQLLSGTELLKRNGSEWSIRAFNAIMMDKEMLEEKERPSKSGAKKFKSLIGEELDFGENQVCPNNPRETQPLYYTDRFDELLTILKR